MGHRHHLVRAVLLACVGALLAALPSQPSAAAPRPADDECAALGRTIASVWDGQRTEEQGACATLAQDDGRGLRFVQPAGQEPVPVRVIDSRGDRVCEIPGGRDPACYPDGKPPYRAVVDPGPTRDFQVSVVQLEAPRRGCPTLQAGRFGTREGNDVSFDGDAFAACFTVPNKALQRRNAIFAYERTSGAGEADLVVRPEVLNHRPECRASGQGGVGRAVCASADQTRSTATVLLVSDGGSSGWRLVRRTPRAGEGTGCQPVASTAIEGPASVGSTGSYVAIDCWSVAAAPTDRFAIDLLDEGGTTTPHVFAGGSYACLVDDEVCLADGRRRYVVVPLPGGPVPESGRDYELQPWLIGDVRGWSSECERFGDYAQPFGPVVGTLTASASGRCVLLDSFTGAAYSIDVGPGATHPALRAVVTKQLGYRERCAPTGEQTYSCDGLSDSHNTVPLLISRPDGTSTLDYAVGGECAPQRTCDVLPPLQALSEPRVVGRHVVGETVTVDTGDWAPQEPSRFTFEWLLDGKPLPFFDQGGKSLQLTREMRGHDLAVRVVAGDLYYESAVVVTEPRTVRRR